MTSPKMEDDLTLMEDDKAIKMKTTKNEDDQKFRHPKRAYPNKEG